MKKYLLALGASLVLVGSLMAVPAPQIEPAPDNSKANQTEANKSTDTAQQQGTSQADRDTTEQIRRSLTKDSSLSTYAHNIKIITRDGKVTLKGPVRSESEKASIEAKAAAIAGAENVRNKLTVAPSGN